MIERWDTRNYDIRLILDLLDSLSLNFDLKGAQGPRMIDINTIFKALIIKEFEKLSLRSAEMRIQDVLGVRIDHSVLHFWEKRRSTDIESTLAGILANLQSRDYSDRFVDSTVITNKKE